MFQFQTGAIRRALSKCGLFRILLSFNSKLVRLEAGNQLILPLKVLISFNSKLVRLEELTLRVRVLSDREFQFQTGSIRRKQAL